MNSLVNYQIAKLLKENGFNIPTLFFYFENFNAGLNYILVDELESQFGTITEKEDHNNIDYSIKRYSAPTISDVVMWLYEKQGIWIRVDCSSKESWSSIIIDVENGNYKVHPLYITEKFIKKNNRLPNSPKEAYEVAIEYCLTNLIKNEF